MGRVLNQVNLQGWLLKEPVLRHTKTGVATTTNGISCPRYWKDKNGEIQRHDCMITFDMYGILAEKLVELGAKGDLVFVSGWLKLDRWEDRDTGKLRREIKVVVKQFGYIMNNARFHDEVAYDRVRTGKDDVIDSREKKRRRRKEPADPLDGPVSLDEVDA